MENKRPLILISNDDGYQAKGINSLIDMLRPLADLVVCAPDGPRSGYSCAFSAEIPLKLDMVIGGINHGDNGSVNSHYSGTMGVVLEGCMKYIPSVAFSLCDHAPDADFEPLRPYVIKYTRYVLEHGLPKGVCLNINFPNAETLSNSPCLGGEQDTPPKQGETEGVFRGVRVCRMAHGSWLNEITTCHHPRGYDYHWMVGHYQNDEPEAEDTDNWALAHGYVAITPTTFDVTAHECLNMTFE